MIREAIETKNYKDRTVVVDKFFEDNIETIETMDSTLNEGTLDDIKEVITKLLKNIKDSDILNDILVRLYKKDFENSINEILDEKGISAVEQEFKEMFFGVSGSFDDKSEFLEALKVGLIDHNSLKGATSVKSITSLLNVYNPFIKKITPRLLKWVPKQMDSSAIGAGEVLLVIYVKGATKAKVGDVNIGSSHYEIKAVKKASGGSGARLKNRGGYRPFTAYYEDFYKDLVNSTGRMDLPNNPNKYNFSLGKIKTFNLYTPETKAKTKTIITKYFAKVYGKDADLSWVQDGIGKDGKLTETFIYDFAYFQYLNYKKLEKFNNIIWFNESNQTVLYSKNDSAVKKDIRSGKIVVTSTVSWNDENSTTFQFGIV